jgi:hypothetical protein
MLNDFYTNHGSAIFIGLFLSLFLSLIISSSRKKTRKERPDPPTISGPIRGMYVCYQCDTIFNTDQCPMCGEEAVVPLIHLTGSIMEDERVAVVISKLQKGITWKLPTFHDGQPIAEASASRPKSTNGGASEVPVTLSSLSESRELS